MHIEEWGVICTNEDTDDRARIKPNRIRFYTQTVD